MSVDEGWEKKDLHDPLERGAERRKRPQQIVFYRDGGETGGFGFKGEEREVKIWVAYLLSYLERPAATQEMGAGIK